MDSGARTLGAVGHPEGVEEVTSKKCRVRPAGLTGPIQPIGTDCSFLSALVMRASAAGAKVGSLGRTVNRVVTV